MSVILMFLAAAVGSADPATAVLPTALQLTCSGRATMPVANTTSASVNGSNGYANGSVTSLGVRETPETMSLTISGDASRIHVPRGLIPPVHSGGDGDWWPLREVKVTETEITGRFTLNFLNKPVVRIDRLSGSIAMDGFKETFRGTCAPTDVTTRKF